MKSLSKILAVVVLGAFMSSAYASSENNAQENVQQTKSFQSFVEHAESK